MIIYNDQSEKIIIERNFLSDKNNKVLRVTIKIFMQIN